MNPSGKPGGIPPVYTRLKDLHPTTDLVKDGEPRAVIVTPSDGIYDGHAARIQEAIEKRSGTKVPIARDDSPEAVVPLTGNRIALGNRSTNRMIEELYNRYFTLLDLKYPGPEGYEVRSLHNPFGGGYNVIFVGGSDASGVSRATDAFVKNLEAIEADRGSLSVGWLMEIELGAGMSPPKELQEFQIWEASVGSRSTGYFGWNSISKRMAMYYMTADPFHAREVIRLAFPDGRAKAEFAEIDGELIENKDDPLAGPYHYGAHMMILYWDLIEESPAFTDPERLRVTNAFSRQFSHPQEQGWRRRIAEEIPKGRAAYADPAPYVGSRHEQWSAIALYCLGRYFERDYGDPLWAQCVASAKWRYSSLHRHAWVTGEMDNLPWYSSANASILQYMLLTGDRKPLENGILPTILRGQEILLAGRDGEPMLNSAALSYLRQAAYLTQDGRWLEYLRRTGMERDVFRLGQSYAPEGHLEPALPEDLAGGWSVYPMPEPMWRARSSGLPFEDSFLFGSFRSAADASGDFLMIKGWNGTGRNPYHSFAILALRLDGQTILDGFLNQVVTRADGAVEPKVAMDAGLRRRDVIGETAVAVGEVPDAPFSNWRRTVIQRLGRYALIVDRLTFRADTENMEAEILWQGKGDWKTGHDPGIVRIEGPGAPFEIALSDPVETSAGDGRARMGWHGAVRRGSEQVFFSVLAGAANSAPVCVRLGSNAAALALPQTGIAVVGGYKGIQGELVVLAQDHLHGLGAQDVSLDALLFRADAPLDVDWAFDRGMLELVAGRETEVRMALAKISGIRMDGEALKPERDGEGIASLRIPEGRHALSGVWPDRDALKRTTGRLERLLIQGQESRRKLPERAGAVRTGTQTVSASFNVAAAERIADLVAVRTEEGPRVFAAAGDRIHVLTERGENLQTLQADGPVRVLRWWEENGLLLAGCADEKVIAFDLFGKRRWTFVSEIDIEVLRAAKQYWFKTAPGHEGVHGLHTGIFLDGKSQAFVGSACTLEVLDGKGELVRRLPVFWGPGVGFGLIEGPERSVNLLIARHPTDMHTLAVVNSRTLTADPRNYYGVPSGHTNISVWGCMYRRHVFVEDLDGDGRKEVIGEIDGTWNRIGVWAEDGTPLANLHLGPGEFRSPPRPCPDKNVRDLDVADLDRDGKKEIVAGLSGGLVIALDHRCRKVWTARMPSPPTVLACPGWESAIRVAVGCEDGTLVALDGKGEVQILGRVDGRPTAIGILGLTAVLGTDTGAITGWPVG